MLEQLERISPQETRMSETETPAMKLSDLDLAALLCSRVCHDLISPVGAIANGLELIDDPEMDAETKETALDMVRSSARTAAAKLKFCRIAFGAAGSAGAVIDLGEAGDIAKAFVGEEKRVQLEWHAPRENRPKQQVKLVLNMVLMALAGIPRGGLVTVTAEGGSFAARAAGDRAKVPEQIAQVLDGTVELTALDARLVQPYYARELARSAGLTLTMAMDGADVVVTAA
jgi:histidine phosphotransferase ChpT